MRKIAFILIAAILPLTVGAQNTGFRQLHEKYAGRDGYTLIEITSAMLDIVRKGNNNSHVNDMIGAIDGIRHISIITAERRNDEFTADLKAVSSPKGPYKLLTSVSEGTQSVMFLYKESESQTKKDGDAAISELVMIVNGESDNLIMCIYGNFSIKQINSAIAKGSGGGSDAQ